MKISAAAAAAVVVVAAAAARFVDLAIIAPQHML